MPASLSSSESKEVIPHCNIYIIGAQCTGKTTLVNALEEELNSPFVIREVARTVLREKHFSREDITTSRSRAFELQKHILEAQFAAEKAVSTNNAFLWYISDRSGLDPIVYGRLFVDEAAADEMLATEAWLELEKRMKDGIVILCEAGCSWLVDDGTRLMPEDIEDWMRVDDAFRALLAARDIDFVIISKDMVDLAERVQSVKKHLGDSIRCK